MAQSRDRNGPNRSKISVITALTVKGFKSIAKEQRMEIRPLTILAGANSSGKSSMMQPALLIKQTLESPYDPPGALLINGPNVKMTEFAQLFWGTGTRQIADSFSVGFEASDGSWFRLTLSSPKHELKVRGEEGPVEEYEELPEWKVRARSRPLVLLNTYPPLQEFERGLIHVPAVRPRSGERVVSPERSTTTSRACSSIGSAARTNNLSPWAVHWSRSGSPGRWTPAN
jgi:hypothetical protein